MGGSRTVPLPSFYFDWKAHKKAVLEDTTPWTPAVNLVFALHEAFKIMKKKGWKAFTEHQVALGSKKLD